MAMEPVPVDVVLKPSPLPAIAIAPEPVASVRAPRATDTFLDAFVLRPIATVSSAVASFSRPIAIIVLPAARPPPTVESARLF